MEKARFPKWVRVLTTKAALVVEKQPFICTLLSNYKLSSLFCVETRFYLKSWNEHENGWDISWKIILKNEHQFDTFYDNVQTGSLYACVKKWVFKSALHWLIDWLIESANQAKERSRRQKFQPENSPAEPGTSVREKKHVFTLGWAAFRAATMNAIRWGIVIESRAASYKRPLFSGTVSVAVWLQRRTSRWTGLTWSKESTVYSSTYYLELLVWPYFPASKTRRHASGSV